MHKDLVSRRKLEETTWNPQGIHQCKGNLCARKPEQHKKAKTTKSTGLIQFFKCSKAQCWSCDNRVVYLVLKIELFNKVLVSKVIL